MSADVNALPNADAASIPTFDKYLYGTCGSVHSCCLASLSLKRNSYYYPRENS